MRSTRRHQLTLLSGVHGAGESLVTGEQLLNLLACVAAACLGFLYMCLKGVRGENHDLQTQCLCMLQGPACASLLSSTLVLPLLICDSDALPGAADIADPCGKLLLQHRRASTSTEEDHTYPGKLSHEHLPTAPSQSRSEVGRLCSSLLCAVCIAALQRVCKYSLVCRGVACDRAVGTLGPGLLFTLCS